MKYCFEGSVLQDQFPTCFSSDHNKISMANTNIDALYAGSLRIKIAYFVSELFSFYKWCLTKVAHCISQWFGST